MKSQDIKKIIELLPVSDNFSAHESMSTEEIEEYCRKTITARMKHCQDWLLNHIDKATATPFAQIAYGKGWHFSLPVYTELEQALTQPMQDWSRLIWQQIVRDIFERSVNNITLPEAKQAFNFATEMLLTKSV